MNIKKFIKRHKYLRKVARRIRHPLYRERKWNLITYNELFGLSVQWAEMLPKDFDMILGVPRSGSIVANIIASKLGKPYSTTEEFLNGKIYFSKGANVLLPQQIKKILLIEDSVGNGGGKLVHEEATRLKIHNPDLEIKIGSLFTYPSTKNIDYTFVHYKPEDVFEWCLLTGYDCGGNIVSDLDGVLVYDEYPNKLFIAPAFRLLGIVTARLEQERPQTEAFLKANNIQYKHLRMRSCSQQSVVDFKAQAAIELNAAMFWESDITQAFHIARIAEIPVYCPSRHVIITNKSKRPNINLTQN